MPKITSVDQLHKLYGKPAETSLAKEVDHVTPEYAKFIMHSPFLALATVAPEGLDCSPRGDLAGFVKLKDPKTLIMPDRRGNNRIDSLSNIVRDPRISLMFLVPGSATVMRVNGQGEVSTDPDLCAEFAVKGRLPRSVVITHVERVYFQCARAIYRSGLWDAESQVDPADLPSVGEMLATITKGQLGGEAYDKDWPERAKASMW